jgi:hypothetical protein
MPVVVAGKAAVADEVLFSRIKMQNQYLTPTLLQAHTRFYYIIYLGNPFNAIRRNKYLMKLFNEGRSKEHTLTS